LSGDPVNYDAIAERLLALAADIRRRPVVQRRPPDTFMIKACIDAFDKELAKVEELAATYATEWSAGNAIELLPAKHPG
jgi:hypothetical protein